MPLTLFLTATHPLPRTAAAPRWQPGETLPESQWRPPKHCFTNATCHGAGCEPSILDEPTASGHLLRLPPPPPARGGARLAVGGSGVSGSSSGGGGGGGEAAAAAVAAAIEEAAAAKVARAWWLAQRRG